jgi:hypothetical protein
MVGNWKKATVAMIGFAAALAILPSMLRAIAEVFGRGNGWDLALFVALVVAYTAFQWRLTLMLVELARNVREAWGGTKPR